MHIPDGFISGPINMATYVVSGGATVAAVRHANRELGDRQVPLLGVTAAFIFAAQMLNFPVAAGTSGHFLGAMLAAVLLGPLNAFLIMAIVLGVQCLAFADGGLTALGTNIFNMGIIGGILSYYIFLGIRAVMPKTRSGFIAAVGAGAWLSVMLASTVCALQLAASGTVPLKYALPAMAGVHAVIGVGEALITTAVVSLVLGVRPDLVSAWSKNTTLEKTQAPRKAWAPIIIGLLLLSLALGVFVSPFASSLPDGLERVAENLGFMENANEKVAWKLSPIPDYAIPGIKNEKTATAVAGLIGTPALFLIGWGAMSLIRRRKPAGINGQQQGADTS